MLKENTIELCLVSCYKTLNDCLFIAANFNGWIQAKEQRKLTFFGQVLE